MAGLMMVGPSEAWADSPLRSSGPFRRGVQVEVMAGPTLCMGKTGCDPAASSRSSPGFGLGGTAGWRFNDWLFLGAGGNMVDRRSGNDEEGQPTFSGIRSVGAYGVLRFSWALRKTDLSADLGVGWSRTQVAVAGPEAVLLQSSGVGLRPALGVHQWLVADYGIGVRAEAMLNLHTDFCATARGCSSDANTLPSAYRDVFFHGLLVGVDLAALFYLRTNP